MNLQLGKIHETVLRHGGETFPRRSRGSVLRDNPNQGAKHFGRNELIRETQKIMLNFSVTEASYLQNTTERAVEQQRNGESAISLLAVRNMCTGSAKARALFAPLFGFSGAYTDPEFMQFQERMMVEYLRQQMPEPAEEDSEEPHPCLFGGEQ